MNKKIMTFLNYFLFFSIIIIDQITKMLAMKGFFQDYGLGNFLTFDLKINRGITWGLLDGQNSWVFFSIGLTVFFIICFLIWHIFSTAKKGLPVFGEILIIAGGISNLSDRIFYHGVTDFILISIGDWQWPIFNIADAAIVVGIVVMLFTNLKNSR